MARAHGIAILGCIFGGVALWFWFARDGEAPPLPPPVPRAAPTAPDADAQGGNLERRSQTTPTPPTPTPSIATPAPKTPAAEPTAAAAPANLLLRVRDVTTLQDLAEFEWTATAGATTLRGSGSAGRAEAALPPDQPFRLEVESQGYQPCVRPGVQVAAALSAPLQLDLFVVPAQRGAGVFLTVTDVQQAPVTQLLVTVRRSTGPGEPVPPPAWSRRATADQGVYELPQLEPGRYKLRLAGLGADGEILPLLPQTREVEVTGSNAVAEAVTLPPANVLTLELVDAAGNFVDPKPRGGLQLRLQASGQTEPLTVSWLTGSGKDKLEARDQLPAAAATTVKEPLPAGEYELRIEQQGKNLVSTRLLLRAGERQIERLVVP